MQCHGRKLSFSFSSVVDFPDLDVNVFSLQTVVSLKREGTLITLPDDRGIVCNKVGRYDFMNVTRLLPPLVGSTIVKADPTESANAVLAP